MLLNRVGNKTRLSPLLGEFFPPHTHYAEPFFGGGGMFFNKPLVPNNYLNDIDKEIFNLFQVITNRYDDLAEAFKLMPVDMSLFEWLKHTSYTDPVWRAARLVYIAQYSYYSMGASLRVPASVNTYKSSAMKKIELAKDFLSRSNAIFTCKDYRTFLALLPKAIDKDKLFIYADPPYADVSGVYKQLNGDDTDFTLKDFSELIDNLLAVGCRFGISEQANEPTIELAKVRGLYVNHVKTQQNMNRMRTDIYISNYQIQNKLF